MAQQTPPANPVSQNPPSQPAPSAPYPPQTGTYPPQTGPYPPQTGPYPPQTGPYPYGAPGTPPIVAIQINNAFNRYPMRMTCPNCHSDILTQIIRQNGLAAWLIAGGLCLLGCWLCFWIPLVMEDCKDVNHICPSCKMILGRFKKMDDC